MAGETERMLADPHYRSFAHEHQSYVEQGTYAGSLRRWLSHFPAEQIHIVLSEDFYADTRERLRRGPRVPRPAAGRPSRTRRRST